MQSNRDQHSWKLLLIYSRIIFGMVNLCSLLLVFIFLTKTSYSQSTVNKEISIIANKVLLAKSKKVNSIKMIDNLLVVAEQTSEQVKKKLGVCSASFFKINTKSLKNAVLVREDLVVIKIPYSDHGESELTLDLLKVSDSFYQTAQKTDPIDTPVHYRGIVRGYENNSLVALSLFRDELAGVVSISGYGNLNIGKSTQDNVHVIYNDRDLKNKNTWTCDVSEKDDISDEHIDNPKKNDQKNKQHKSSSHNIPNLSDVTIEVFVAVDYDIYSYFNGNNSSIDAFVTTQFNQVFAIYENEGINLEISEIYKYDTPDNFGEFPLTQFAAATPIFDGHFAHLLSIKQSNANGGGQAILRGLCRNSLNYSESRITIDDVFFPTFSNNIYVIAHEIGHVLGSEHTHECVWNGNASQIDDCGNVYFTTDGFDNNGNEIIDELSEAEGSQCFNQQQPVIPNIGTIMSYCHLDPDVSVDLASGFHQQTGDRIRDFIVNAGCFFGDPILGDVNLDGYADVIDALFITLYEVTVRVEGNCSNVVPPTGTICLKSGDVNDDGSVNIIDALFISQCEVQVPNVMCPD